MIHTSPQNLNLQAPRHAGEAHPPLPNLLYQRASTAPNAVSAQHRGRRNCPSSPSTSRALFPPVIMHALQAGAPPSSTIQEPRPASSPASVIINGPELQKPACWRVSKLDNKLRDVEVFPILGWRDVWLANQVGAGLLGWRATNWSEEGECRDGG